MAQYKYIIVGAGYAGITAGCELAAYFNKSIAKSNNPSINNKFLILEARDRVGGRTWTKHLPDGSKVDLGAGWIGHTQDKMYELAKKYNVPVYPQFDEGLNILSIEGKISKYKGLIPPLSIKRLLQFQWGVFKLGWHTRKINIEQPWLSKEAKYLDSLSFQEWIDQTFSDSQVRGLFTKAMECVFATNLNQVSFLHALFYVKSGKDFDTLINIRNGAQKSRVAGGSQVIAERMAEQIKDHIKLEHPVKQIDDQGKLVRVITDKGEFTCEKVIMTTPPTVTQNINFTKPLPPQRQKINKEMQPGNVFKCWVIYDEPFWRKEGYSGLTLGIDQIVTFSLDCSPPDLKKGILMGFVLADNAKYKFLKLSEEQRKAEILQLFAKYYGEKALKPSHYIDYCFSKDQWTLGCYAGMMPKGLCTSAGEYLTKPFGNVHWAGTETSAYWSGYMEGAVRSGERVIKELIN